MLTQVTTGDFSKPGVGLDILQTSGHFSFKHSRRETTRSFAAPIWSIPASQHAQALHNTAETS